MLAITIPIRYIPLFDAINERAQNPSRAEPSDLLPTDYAAMQWPSCFFGTKRIKWTQSGLIKKVRAKKLKKPISF
jgi:hypothetical protein